MSLSDSELADHFEKTLEHSRSAMVLHFRLHISDLGPIGRLLDHTASWGIDPSDVMPTLAGASPGNEWASGCASRHLPARSPTPTQTRPHSTRYVRSAIQPHNCSMTMCLSFGKRLTTGYDLVHRTLGEMPDVILATVGDPQLLGPRSAAESAAERGEQATPRGALGGYRRKTSNCLTSSSPTARRLYGLRDENGPITVEWPCGVLRLIMLETGRRLVAVGRLRTVSHVFDLSADELSGCLRGEPGPHAEAVANPTQAALIAGRLPRSYAPRTYACSA